MLKTVLLSPHLNIETISHSFFQGCVALEEFDLGAFPNVIDIGSDFLSECSALHRLHTAGLANKNTLQNIGDNFLGRCSSLVDFDMKGFSGVRTIGSGFLNRSGVTFFELSRLPCLSRIP
eukprot:PhF_6_TR31876/c1_g1_i9/m.47348